MKVVKANFLWKFLIISSIICTSTAWADGVEYREGRNRDPFEPLLSKNERNVSGIEGVESIDDIEINGIVYDPGSGSIAMVNGVMLQEGQTEGRVKALRIDRNGVEFEIDGVVGYKPYQDEES